MAMLHYRIFRPNQSISVPDFKYWIGTDRSRVDEAQDCFKTMLLRYSCPTGVERPGLPVLDFGNIILPWNAVCTGLADEFQRQWRRPWLFPEIQVLENPLDHRRIFDEEDNLHFPGTLWAFQSINVPDLPEENFCLLRLEYEELLFDEVESSAAGTFGKMHWRRSLPLHAWLQAP